jgi:hypothetical protein
LKVGKTRTARGQKLVVERVCLYSSEDVLKREIGNFQTEQVLDYSLLINNKKHHGS